MLSFFKQPTIRGGVHAIEHKAETSGAAIFCDFPLPSKFYIPLQQHVGKPAEPLIKVGDRVLKGQLLAYSQGLISAPIHAPTSGIIVDVSDYPAPHPSALPIRTVVLASDGQEQWQKFNLVNDPFALEPEEISLRVGAAGIVGLGGATFPAAVKLSQGRKNKVHTLLINGGECEPYLTCDDRLMQERAAQVIDGIRIMLHGLGAAQAIVAIEDNKELAFLAMQTAAQPYPYLSVVQVPTRYPMGWDRQLIRYLTGKEVPAESRSTDVGVTMHNVGTAYAVHRALRTGQPLISKIVTVAGAAVAKPMNVEVLIGTLTSEVLDFCGVDNEKTARLVMGGPMMGESLPHSAVPIVKGSSGILALAASELKSSTEQACIRCGSCVNACPAGLLPLEMMSRIRSNQLDAAVGFGLKDCISCGSCSYVCPSNIPLVHYFKYASGELAARQQAQHKTEQTKRLMQDKQARLERIKQQQDEEMRQMKLEKQRRELEKAQAQAQEVQPEVQPETTS
jgi:electron transport complex protein RnfC